jgi:hypothetical protein
MVETGTGVALDDATTRGQLARYRSRSRVWLAAGLVGLVVFGLLVAPMLDPNRDPTAAGYLGGLGVAAAVLAVVVGAGGLVRASRMQAMLGRSPWVRWAVRFRQERFGSYERNSLRLVPEGAGSDQPAVVVRLPSMLKATLAHSGLEHARAVDVAGEPTTGHAVVRAAGHDILVPLRPARPSVR